AIVNPLSGHRCLRQVVRAHAANTRERLAESVGRAKWTDLAPHQVLELAHEAGRRCAAPGVSAARFTDALYVWAGGRVVPGRLALGGKASRRLSRPFPEYHGLRQCIAGEAIGAVGAAGKLPRRVEAGNA